METNKKLQNLIGKILGRDCYGRIKYKAHHTINIPFRHIETEMVFEEPTLNDVLLAIDNTINSWDFLIYANGTMSYNRKEFKYDLSKSIFNQEESVKVAIINLLEDK